MSVIFYLFWGPLFPWNPVKIGYKKFTSSKATLYINEMTEKDSIVYRINDLIIEEEQFHDLNYLERFKIVVLSKGSKNKRFLPWLNGSGYSISLSPLNLIYIGSTARRSAWGIEPYLRHELSHLLVGQNTTYKNARKIHKQAWLVEGIAEYFSKHSFYDQDELVELIKQNDFQISTLDNNNPLEMSWQELQLKYSYYRYLVEFLIEEYGMKKLQEYLKRYLRDPENYQDSFISVYSIGLNEVVEKYHTGLMGRE